VINTLRQRFGLGDPLTARVAAAPTLERVLSLGAPENLGPETITASDFKVGPLYKFNSMREKWNDFQASLHDMARKMPAANNKHVQEFVDRHVTQPDPQQPDGVNSDFGAMWGRGKYLALKPFRGGR
jgi:hypothetical protein